MRSELTNILKDITDWLKFAEAKNLALMTFNSAWLIAYLKKFFETDNFALKTVYTLGCLCCIIPIIFCFISIIPKLLNYSKLQNYLIDKLGSTSPDDNLLYYRDISKYKYDEYYEKIQINFFNITPIDTFDSNANQYEKTLIKQIIDLSGIAYKKYFLFSIAISITLTPFILMFFFVIIA